MNRRKFLKSSSGLFVPAMFGIAIAKAQLPVFGPPRSVASSAYSWSLVQHAAPASNGATATYATTNFSGDLLIAYVIKTGSGIATPTDSQGNTWVDSGIGEVNNNNTLYQRIFYVVNCAAHAAGNVVTSTGAQRVHLEEWSGAATSSLVDQFSSHGSIVTSSGNNNIQCGPMTTTQNGDLVVAWGICGNGPLSAGSNVAWTSPDGDKSGLNEYFVQSSSGAITGSITTGSTGDNACIQMVSFKLHP